MPIQTGTPGDDQLTGTAQADELYGLAGADTLDGGDGYDILDGGDGDDILYLGGGADTVSGGAGDDVFHDGDATSGTGDHFNGGDGIDTIIFSEPGRFLLADPDGEYDQDFTSGVARLDTYSAVERFVLSDGDDWFVGGGRDIHVFGGGGNDRLYGGVFGPAGTVSWEFSDAGMTIDELSGVAAPTSSGSEGTDTFAGFATIIGSTFDDIITAKRTINIVAGDGDDHITGGTNLYGGAGDDVLAAGGQILDGGTGADVMQGGDNAQTYFVDDLGDVVSDSEVSNQISDIDTVVSSVAFELVANVENLELTGVDDLTGTGNELKNNIIGNTGDNLLDGKAGNDRIESGDGSDTLLGGEGHDLLNGGAGNDSLNGGTGDDVLDGGLGADVLQGREGDDTYHVDDAGDLVVEGSSAWGIDTVNSSAGFVLGRNLENLVLTGAAVADATGNDLNNAITGNAGANVIDGRAGADRMAGREGDDVYYVDNAGDQVVENSVHWGFDSVFSSVSFVLDRNVETLRLTGWASIDATGNDGANQLTGNAGNNVIDGGSGADVMQGREGNDTYVVNSSADQVIEGSFRWGVDTVQSAISYTLGANVENLVLISTGTINGTGNSLANILVGNTAANRLTGGAGADVFDFNTTGQSTAQAYDTIVDLTAEDRIDLSNVDANVNRGGNQGFVIVDQFTKAAGQMTVKFYEDLGITSMLFDVNGDGKADMKIVAEGDHHDFAGFIL